MGRACEVMHLVSGRVSLNTPHQRSQVPTLNPSLTLTTTTLPPPITYLPDNPRRLPRHDHPCRDMHPRGHNRVRENLGILLDDAEGTQDTILANVDVRCDLDGGDNRALADEDVVENPHGVEGHGAVVDAHGWAEGAVC